MAWKRSSVRSRSGPPNSSICPPFISFKKPKQQPLLFRVCYGRRDSTGRTPTRTDSIHAWQRSVGYGLSRRVRNNCGSSPPRTATEELEITSHDPNVGRFGNIRSASRLAGEARRFDPDQAHHRVSPRFVRFGTFPLTMSSFPAKSRPSAPRSDTEEDSRHFGACRPN